MYGAALTRGRLIDALNRDDITLSSMPSKARITQDTYQIRKYVIDIRVKAALDNLTPYWLHLSEFMSHIPRATPPMKIVHRMRRQSRNSDIGTILRHTSSIILDLIVLLRLSRESDTRVENYIVYEDIPMDQEQMPFAIDTFWQ
jgi:hypothetical protein